MEHFDIVVVGAGLSGIGAGYHLQTNCPNKAYAILEGRDIGTVIFQDADVKFFLTASVEERAKRRLIELGVDPGELEAIGARTKGEVQYAIDRARAAPPPDPATVLDNVYGTPALSAIPG